MEIIRVFEIIFIEKSCFLYFFIDFLLDQVEELILFIQLILHNIPGKEPVKYDILFDVGFFTIRCVILLPFRDLFDNLLVCIDLVFLLIYKSLWFLNKLFELSNFWLESLDLFQFSLDRLFMTSFLLLQLRFNLFEFHFISYR